MSRFRAFDRLSMGDLFYRQHVAGIWKKTGPAVVYTEGQRSRNPAERDQNCVRVDERGGEQGSLFSEVLVRPLTKEEQSVFAARNS